MGGEERAAAADTIRRMGERLEALREMRINRELGADDYADLRHQAERAMFEARAKLNAPTGRRLCRGRARRAWEPAWTS